MKRNWQITRLLSKLFSPTNRTQKKSRPTARLSLERLEERWLPSAMTFLVTNTNDNGAGSLRAAILDSNANSAGVTAVHPNSINFAISSGGAVQVINVGDNSGGGGTLNQALPALTVPITINGYSEPLSSFGSGPFFSSAKILIELNGAAVGLAAPDTSNAILSGLDVEGGGATIMGLSIVHFDGDGILLATHGSDAVTGNYLGVNPAGVGSGFGNGASGVLIQAGAAGSTVGGVAAGRGNVISGNDYMGIEIQASGNAVLGNLIGTDKFGTAGLGNAGDGVLIDEFATHNTIGGTATGAGNVISGNGTNNGELGSFNGNGVEIAGLAGADSGNVVQGNLIGTDKTGAVKLGNLWDGVLLSNSFIYGPSAGSLDNTIGGTAAGAGNVISGNGNHGIEIAGAGVSANLVQGNFIGTNKAGTGILGNAKDGIVIDDGASRNRIGGTAAGAGNVISGNGTNNGTLGQLNGEGVEINGMSGAVSGNVVLGNLIGTDKTGALKLGNLYDGVLITTNSVSVLGALGNTIGGTAAGAGNVISGNGNHGLELSGDVSGNLVQGNFIGANKAGTAILGNARDGILMDAAPTNNTIGGTAAGAGNVISGNGTNDGTLGTFNGAGVEINGSFSPVSGNVVQGNLIGTDKTGSVKLGNLWSGVLIVNDFNYVYATGALNNTIGGTVAGAGNVISGNGNHGVEIGGADVSGNVVQGNFIGVNKAGTGVLGNARDGILIDASPTNNTIGGTAAGAGNVISGNGSQYRRQPLLRQRRAFYNGNGVEINGSFGVCSGNVVEGNFIGTDKSGNLKLGNVNNGVVIASTVTGLGYPTGATGNTIGGTTAGAGNVISGNANGVLIDGTAGSGASGNLVLGNKIGTNKSGTLLLGNNLDGVYLLGGASNNTIGGTTSGTGNIIAFGAEGVVLSGTTTVGDSILGNSIYANKGLGIDLGTPPGNHGQHAPVTTAETATSYSATLTSPNGTYRVEVFATPAPSAVSGSANFQGKMFLGATNVVITAGGKAFTVTGLMIPAGSTVTSTATNLGTNDTSGFSTIATTTKVTSNPAITQNFQSRTITLTAFVSGAQTVDAGTVSFTIVGIGGVTVNVGANGVATANFVVPANTPAGQYQIIAVYNGADEFNASTSDPQHDGTLTVMPST